MNSRYYFSLAFLGIKKNKKYYLPYILTCTLMICMFFIIANLSYNNAILSIKSGENVKFILELGKWVIAIFSTLFLFYTNSFLMGKRNKEFGLYNILGVDKHNISKIVIVELSMIFVIVLVVGISLGLLLSKLAELSLLNVLKGEIVAKFFVSGKAVLVTFFIFLAVFFLITINSIIKVKKTNAIDLMHSSNMGEKPLKANNIFAVIGMVCLGLAYYLAIKKSAPLNVILSFFIAVLLVIVATFILLIVGSVAVCKALQKNKKYYYKKNHFVSISMVAHRMKRNGAGLASICVLSTMVMVMLTSVFGLYIGADDSLNNRCPKDFCISSSFNTVDTCTETAILDIKQNIDKELEKEGVNKSEISEYTCGKVIGAVDDKIEVSSYQEGNVIMSGDDNYCLFYFIPLLDYNKSTNNNVTLNDNEILIQSEKFSKWNSLNFADYGEFKIQSRVNDFKLLETSQIPICCVFMNDINDVMKRFMTIVNTQQEDSENFSCTISFNYGFNVDLEQEKQIELKDKLDKTTFASKDKLSSFEVSGKEDNRSDFYSTFGGLFFIGIILSIVFLLGTVLIIYYKQITEGFEDQSRFDIMQKVGMTKVDIRKSINSQLLLVFFAPLILAGLHLGFATPFLWRMLQLFGFVNLKLIILVACGTFLLFTIFYTLVFRLTSNAYYKIVSEMEK